MQDGGEDLAAVAVAVDRARAAQPAWASLGFPQRARALRRLVARVRGDDEVARLIGQETGKPAFEAVGIEVAYLCELTRFLSGRAGRRAVADAWRGSLVLPHKRARVSWQPRGVVAVVGPSNFPLLNNFGDAVAPLLAGNAVLLKPSPRTPGTSSRIEALWHEAGLPPGVFQVVAGGADTAMALADACDMVFFTGSVAAGRAIAARAGARTIPCVTELGGKSAMIVLADADVPAAAHAAVWGAFAGAGQVCIRVERVLVEDTVADELVRRMADEVRALRLSGPSADVRAGGVFPESDRWRAQLADALDRGATLVVGGGDGPSLPPTLLDRVPPAASVAVDETFGPILPVVRVGDVEEAIRLANASSLGLAGYVWSGDAHRARSIASRLEAGTVCINDVLINYFMVSSPLGGRKGSGLGFRHGPESLRQFCVPQSIVEDRPWARPLARWLKRQLGFPYRDGVLRVLRSLLRIIYR